MISSRRSLTEKLREQLQNPDILEKIRVNSKCAQQSRLFDELPDEFDAVFDEDGKADARELANILLQIETEHQLHPVNNPSYNNYVFTHIEDQTCIKNWAKNIIANICHEFLTTTNELNAETSELFASKDISARSFVSSYFVAACQYTLKILCQLDLAAKFGLELKTTLSNYTNDFPQWIDETLQDRIR